MQKADEYWIAVGQKAGKRGRDRFFSSHLEGAGGQRRSLVVGQGADLRWILPPRHLVQAGFRAAKAQINTRDQCFPHTKSGRKMNTRIFDSSTGFQLADGSVLSPDASLVREERWQALSPEQRRGRLDGGELAEGLALEEIWAV